jgi:hypothetical protein
MKSYTNTEKIKMFINEINDISDSKLREFAVRILLDARDYFYTVPASTSGKYHPPFAQGDGGLVRHTRCVVFFAKSNAESFDFNQHDTDLLIIAALAHDIMKQGDCDRNTTKSHTVYDHPQYGHDFILREQLKYSNLISIEDANKIAKAILSHMGKWAHHPEFVKNKKQYPMPNDLFEQALQSADYTASRTEILEFNFRTTDNVVIPEDFMTIINEFDRQNIIMEEVEAPNFTNEENAGDYVFTFGKYKDKSIKDINEINPQYFDWMLEQSGFKNKEALNMVKTFLKKERLFT